MRKKRVLIAILACTMVAGIVMLAFFGRKPFSDLAASDIVSATAVLNPPDKVIPITAPRELATYLQEIVIYNEDNSHTAYTGQTIQFILDMVDGSQMKITACNPFIVIDGIRYHTKYKPCEELSSYVNRLCNDRE